MRFDDSADLAVLPGNKSARYDLLCQFVLVGLLDVFYLCLVVAELSFVCSKNPLGAQALNPSVQ
jgi:hypothetical protein